jgi:hypothetical protein
VAEEPLRGDRTCLAVRWAAGHTATAIRRTGERAGKGLSRVCSGRPMVDHNMIWRQISASKVPLHQRFGVATDPQSLAPGPGLTRKDGSYKKPINRSLWAHHAEDQPAPARRTSPADT